MKALELKNRQRIGERGHFPRPDCLRAPSYLLDGEWQLCPDKRGRGFFQGWHGRDFGMRVARGEGLSMPEAYRPSTVRVPFPLESEINQRVLTQRGLTPMAIGKTGRFWYFRKFRRPEGMLSGVLRFGAADYRASVWLNGVFLGRHEGGYTPFSFVVPRFEDENILTVLVEDSPSMSQVRGKQTFLKNPFMVWYPGCTGIWQSVWIEPVDRIYIHDVQYRRDEKNNVVFSITVHGLETAIRDVSGVLKLYASQSFGDSRGNIKTPVKEYTEFTMLDAMKTGRLEFTVPDKLFTKWSPEWPTMHPIELVLRHGKKDFDTVFMLFGSRQIEIEDGIIRLNRKKLYQRLVLNQGYFPRGQYSPESPDQFRADIELMKKSGFNGCRMHQKIEHPAFLYWADLLGFLVWEEMPSYYLPSAKNMGRLEAQLGEVVRRDMLHPSVITLVLYNESWGAYNIFLSSRARRGIINLFDRCKAAYPGYLIIDNSGFHHLKTDITDIHHYIPGLQEVEQFYSLIARGVREAPFWYNFIRMLGGNENVQTPFLRKYGETKSPVLISEMGGFGFSLYEHEDITLEQFLKKHIDLLVKFPSFQGFCYTQFTDTFQEGNGLFTLERSPKVANLRDYIEKPFITHKYDKTLSR